MNTAAIKRDEPISQLVEGVKQELGRAKEELDSARLQLQTQRQEFQRARLGLSTLMEQMADSLQELREIRGGLDEDLQSFTEEMRATELASDQARTLNAIITSLKTLSTDTSGTRLELQKATSSLREALDSLSQSSMNLRTELQSLSDTTEMSVRLSESAKNVSRLYSEIEKERTAYDAEKKQLETLSSTTRDALDSAVGVMESLKQEVVAARRELSERANMIRQAFNRLTESSERLRDEVASLQRTAQAPMQSRRNCPKCGRALSGGEFFCDGCGENLTMYLV